MNIKAVALRAFRSFTQDQVFNFADRPGFYFLGGDNQVDESLGANAVGKSSIFEGIVWCLYGSTSRGLYAPALKSTDSEEVMSVVMEFELDDELYSLTRTHKPNTLVMQQGAEGTPRTVTQDEVQDLVRIPKAAFLHSSFIGQFSVYFLALQGADRMKLISSVLDLQAWEKAATKASSGAKAHKAQRDFLELETVRKKQAFASADQEFKDSAEALEESEKLHAQAVKVMKGERGRAQKKLTAIAAQQDALTARLLDEDREALALQPIVDKAQAKLSESTNTLGEATYARSVAQAQRLAATKLYNAALETDECPTCGSVRGGETVLEAASVGLEASKDDYDAANLAYALVDRTHGTRADTLDEAMTQMQIIGDIQDEIRYEMRECEREHQTLVRSTEVAEAKQGNEAGLERERVAHKRRKTRRDKAKVSATKARASLHAASKSYEDCKFWVESFKDIRTWMLSDAICELEVRANNCIRDLGLEDWEITFEVEKENASGTTKKGCHVNVTDPTGETRQWEAWSGGEAQRLAIAVEVSIAEMVRSRYGVTTTFEIWDEPTAHLSSSGVQDLLEFLKIRARQQNLEIWLIDHREPDSGDFDASVTVVKTDKGSRIVW